jgi:hypothetical protein
LSFFWSLLALGPLFLFLYALIGAAGAGELTPEYDYAEDFTAEDYPTTGSRPIDSEIPIRHCYIEC